MADAPDAATGNEVAASEPYDGLGSWDNMRAVDFLQSLPSTGPRYVPRIASDYDNDANRVPFYFLAEHLSGEKSP